MTVCFTPSGESVFFLILRKLTPLVCSCNWSLVRPVLIFVTNIIRVILISTNELCGLIKSTRDHFDCFVMWSTFESCRHNQFLLLCINLICLQDNLQLLVIDYDPFTEWHSTTYQKTWIFTTASVGISNQMKSYVDMPYTQYPDVFCVSQCLRAWRDNHTSTAGSGVTDSYVSG